MKKKCPNCGACAERGARPPYAVQPYPYPMYPQTSPRFPTYVGTGTSNITSNVTQTSFTVSH